MFTIFNKFNLLNTFDKYINAGVSQNITADLGFRYLKKNYVLKELETEFPDDRIHEISMDDLFSDGKVKLNQWYSEFDDINAINIPEENKRSVSKDIKIAHLRPIWSAKRKFYLKKIIEKLISHYKSEFFSHTKLEVKIRLDREKRDTLNKFLK